VGYPAPTIAQPGTAGYPRAIVETRAPLDGQEFEWTIDLDGATGGTFALNLFQGPITQDNLRGQTGPIPFDADAQDVADAVDAVRDAAGVAQAMAINGYDGPLPAPVRITFGPDIGHPQAEWTLQMTEVTLTGAGTVTLVNTAGFVTDSYPAGTLWTDTVTQRLYVQAGAPFPVTVWTLLN
jgi:hypothetical protein